MVDIRHDLLRPLIRVSGELDIASAPLLVAMIDHVGSTHPPAGDTSGDTSGCIDVDLSQVTFADSHGLAPVLDGRAAVLAASAPVRRVLNLLQQHPSQLRAAVLLRRGRPRRLSNIATRSATATQTHRALLDRGGEHRA